jgi:hypothetical protein
MDQAQFASLIAVVLTRATERILLVLVGALAIYLGYLLFRNIPNAPRTARGEGKIELPGGVSIFLTRIGPGVFFALFGIAVVGYSVTKPIQFGIPAVPAAGSTTVVSGGVTYSGAAQRELAALSSAPASPVAGPEPEIVVAKLNGVYEEAQKRLNTPAAAELADMVRAAKYAVMLGRWKPEWGDREKFARWARENGTKDPPRELFPDAYGVFNTPLP